MPSSRSRTGAQVAVTTTKVTFFHQLALLLYTHRKYLPLCYVSRLFSITCTGPQHSKKAVFTKVGHSPLPHLEELFIPPTLVPLVSSVRGSSRKVLSLTTCGPKDDVDVLLSSDPGKARGIQCQFFFDGSQTALSEFKQVALKDLDPAGPQFTDA